MRRVVVTGFGAVTAYGLGWETLWEALIAGKSGITEIVNFETSDFPTHFAGEVKDLDPSTMIDKKLVRRMGRFTHFAVMASQLALDDSGFEVTEDNAHRVGVIVGSGCGGLDVVEQQYEILLEKGARRMSPFTVPMMISDMAAGHISMRFGVKGPNYCPVSACASSNHAIGEGFETIKRGAADVCFVGGAEGALTRLGLGAFSAARALSTRNDEPQKASRPFDVDRDGFVMAEGSGIAILESLEHAEARGADICCEVLGYGASGDAYDMTAPEPSGEGARWAMRAALEEAGIRPEEVDYINAHGTSTQAGDPAEVAAVKDVFGEHAYQLTMSSTKSMTGHLLGAAGAVELIATAMALKTGICPPTINLDEPDEGMDLDFAAHEARERDVRVALSNSFGFGGHNATIALGRLDR